MRPEAVAVRRAFDLAATGQYRAATDALQAAINGLDDRPLRGWLTEQKAAYLDLVDRVAAQQALAGALRDNGFVLKPEIRVDPAQVRATTGQARAAAEYLSAQYGDPMQLVLGIRALLDEIQWDKDRTPDAEAAWEKLGLHLGFASNRPEKLYGTGPDNLWALSPTLHAVTELKTGCDTATIAKKDLDQLGGSVRWDAGLHPTVNQIAVMVHPSRTPHAQAVPVPGMRVVTLDKLDEFKHAMTGDGRRSMWECRKTLVR